MNAKALLIIIAALLLLSRWHVTVWLAGAPCSVPLPVLALAAEMAVCAALGWLIARAAGYRPRPFPWRLA